MNAASRFSPLVLAAMLLVGALTLAPGVGASSSYADVTITSFDGTPLAATVFTPADASAASPVPFVLMTHGWAGQRVATPTGRVADLLDAGYGVLTWDSRGFGSSGGEVQLDSPDYEGRDVSVLIDWLLANAPVALEAADDPIVGMSGGSYAGGIQLLAAAHDARIDVIAPEITWNDLVQSLGPNGVPKLYWTSLLLGAGAEASCVNARNNDPQGALAGALASGSTGCQTNDLARYYAMVHAENGIPDEVRDALLLRSPKTYMDDITIPTLLVQGFPDTLFDVDQAAANYAGIKANGAPVKLWLYDGGHSHPENAALVPDTQGHLISGVVVTWFDRYLKGDENVDTGPEVEYFVDGAWHGADAWPLPDATARTLHVGGVPSLVAGAVVPTDQGRARIALPTDGAALAVGGARIAFDVTGAGAPEALAFFALERVDAAGTATRLGDQTQPARFAVGPTDTHVEVDLVDVATRLAGDDTLVLTIATSDVGFGQNRLPATLNIHDVLIDYATGS